MDVSAGFLEMLRGKAKTELAYHNVAVLQFKWLGLDAFRTKTFGIDESTVGTFDVFDEDL